MSSSNAFNSYSTKKVSIPSGLGGEVSDELKKIVDAGWSLPNTIVHTNNHINNVHRMTDKVLDDYLEDGFQSFTSNLKDLKGEAVKREMNGVSGEDLRRELGISEEIWANPKQKAVVKEYLREMMFVHDAAKIDTSHGFLYEASKLLPNQWRFADVNGNIVNTLPIQLIHESFSVNIFREEKTDTFDEKKWKVRKRIDINVINKIDDTVGNRVTYNFKKRFRSVGLSPDDLKKMKSVAKKLEVMIDRTERWGNQVSILEFGRRMIAQSLGTIKLGKLIILDKDKCGIFCRMTARLEFDYEDTTIEYPEYDKNIANLFSRVEAVTGVKMADLHPVKRYELIPLLQNGHRDLLYPSDDHIKKILFGQNEISELLSEDINFARLAEINKIRDQHLLEKLDAPRVHMDDLTDTTILGERPKKGTKIATKIGSSNPFAAIRNTNKFKPPYEKRRAREVSNRLSQVVKLLTTGEGRAGACQGLR